jgi:prevent-host-death family protein
MQINVTEAKGQLLDLVRRAEAGEEIILSRHGEAVVRLTPIKRPVSAERRRQALLAARGKILGGVPAARSQDFLYDDKGLPA